MDHSYATNHTPCGTPSLSKVAPNPLVAKPHAAEVTGEGGHGEGHRPARGLLPDLDELERGDDEGLEDAADDAAAKDGEQRRRRTTTRPRPKSLSCATPTARPRRTPRREARSAPVSPRSSARLRATERARPLGEHHAKRRARAPVHAGRQTRGLHAGQGRVHGLDREDGCGAGDPARPKVDPKLVRHRAGGSRSGWDSRRRARESIDRARSTPTRERRGSRWNEVGSGDPRWTGRIHGNAIDRARVDSRVSSSRSRRLRLPWLSLWGDCCFSAQIPFSQKLDSLSFHILQLNLIRSEAFLLTQPLSNLFAREGSGGLPLDAAHVIRESHAHLQAAIEAAQVRHSIITSLPLASHRSSRPVDPQPAAGVRWICPPGNNVEGIRTTPPKPVFPGRVAMTDRIVHPTPDVSQARRQRGASGDRAAAGHAAGSRRGWQQPRRGWLRRFWRAPAAAGQASPPRPDGPEVPDQGLESRGQARVDPDGRARRRAQAQHRDRPARRVLPRGQDHPHVQPRRASPTSPASTPSSRLPSRRT